MLAAAMQTCSAALNSSATLFAYDIVKRWRPTISDHHLVTIGKITTAVATVIAIVISPLFGHYSTIFEGLNRLIAYIAPPITTVFLFGVFWKKASGRAAFVTLVWGALLGGIIFVFDFWQDDFAVWFEHNSLVLSNGFELFRTHVINQYMLTAFYLLLVCCTVMFVASKLMPEAMKEEAKTLVWEDWREPLRGEAHGRGLGNYRILSATVVGIFVVLYFIFR